MNTSRYLTEKFYGSRQRAEPARKKTPAERTADKYTKAIKKAYKDYSDLLVRLEVLPKSSLTTLKRYRTIKGTKREGLMFVVTVVFGPVSMMWSIVNQQEAQNWETKKSPLIRANVPNIGDTTYTSGSNSNVTFDIYVTGADARVMTGKDNPSHADVLRVFQPMFSHSAGSRVYPLGELPPIKDEKALNNPKEWKMYKLADGSFIYFPVIDIVKEADEYERDYYDRLQKWEEHLHTDLSNEYPRPEAFKFHNTVIYSDPASQIIIYYTEDRKRRTFTATGASPYITASDIVTLMDRPGSAIENVFQHSPFRHSRLLYFGKEALVSALNQVKREWVVKPDEENGLPAGAYKTDGASPITQLQLYAILKLMADNIDRVDALKESIAEERSAIRKLTPQDVPPLPHWRKDRKVFPHQALTLARSARVDVFPAEIDMGGGKTMLMLYTALIKLMTGKVKRPLIVMPTKLVSQQVNEMREWTAGTVNIIPLVSKSYSTYGKEEYEHLITNAPPNTIFITTYEWLMNETRSVWDEGANRFIDIYTRPVWLKQLGVDMVMLDESHKIKSNRTKTYKAVATLTDVPVKSAFSGTMISNNPTDLVAQVSFLDPMMFGKDIDFYKEYVQRVGRSSQPAMWKEGATKRIREKFRSHGGVMLSKAAWLSLLPPRTVRIHKVEMDPVIQAAYKRNLERSIEEFRAMADDPSIPKKTRDRIRAFLEASDSVKEELPPQIIQQLNELRLFLCAPDVDPVIQEMEEANNIKILSPKIKVIDRLLDKHFATDEGKVLIFVINKAAAKHIQENIKYSDIAVYYDASKKEALDKFNNDPNVKILVGVDMSLKEGFNLTHATRVIRAQLNWNMGDEEQSYARAYRPGQKSHVNVDILLTDKTLEITMFARLVSKLHVNTLVKTDYEVGANSNLKIITMNLASLKEVKDFDEHLTDYIATFEDIERFTMSEAVKYAEVLGDQMLDVQRAKPVARRVIPVPTIPGASPPIDQSITPILPPPKAKSSTVRAINEANKTALTNIRKLAPLALADTVPFVLDDKQYEPPKPAQPEKTEKTQPKEEPERKLKKEGALPDHVYVAFVLAGAEYGLRLYTKKPYPQLKPFGFQFFRKSKARVVPSKVSAVQALITLHNNYDGGVCDLKLMGRRIKVLPVPDKAEGSLTNMQQVRAYDPDSEVECLFMSLAVYKGRFIVSLPDVYDITGSQSVLSKAKLVKREPSYIQFTTPRKVEFKRALSRLSKFTNIVNKREIIEMFRKVSKVN